MSRRRRHWKQHWDPEAKLVFARRLKLGDNPKKPFALPGDMVTKKMREKLGAHRLRRWFENGTIEIADFKPRERQRELSLAEQAERERVAAEEAARLEAERAAAEQQSTPEEKPPADPAGETPELAAPAGDVAQPPAADELPDETETADEPQPPVADEPTAG